MNLQTSPSTTLPAMPRKRSKPPRSVTATGSRQTRIKKARHYLGKRAWVPTNPADRNNSLLIVMCNLRLYLQLPSELAVVLVLEYYNPRCTDKSGNPSPWTAEEIHTKYTRAGDSGMYPTLGVSDPKATQRTAVENLEKEIKRFLRRRTKTGGCCNPTDLRHAFIAYRGGVDVNATAFGRAVFAAKGIKTATPFGKRVYRGFQILETGSGLTNTTRHMVKAA
jgi:hypothetical protein